MNKLYPPCGYLYYFQFKIIQPSWIRQWNEAWRLFKMGYEWNLARVQNWWVVKTFFIALIVGNFMVLPASPNYYSIVHILIFLCSLCKCEKPFWVLLNKRKMAKANALRYINVTLLYIYSIINLRAFLWSLSNPFMWYNIFVSVWVMSTSSSVHLLFIWVYRTLSHKIRSKYIFFGLIIHCSHTCEWILNKFIDYLK